MKPLMFASAYRQLTPQERSFVDTAVRTLDEAATRAKERITEGLYKPLPPALIDASKGFLERPLVTAAITERVTEIAAERDLTVRRIEQELMAIAFSSMGNYATIDDDGTPYFNLASCTPEQWAAVKSIDIETSGDGITRDKRTKLKIQLHDKLAAIKILAEYTGMTQGEWKQPGTEQQTATAAKVGDAYAAMLGDT